MNNKQEELKNHLLSIRNLRLETLEWKGQDTRKRVITDDKDTLYGVMGRNYQPIGHGDLYAQVTEWLPEVNVVGVAHGGRNYSRAIFTFELPNTFDIKGQEIKTYVNLINSLDGMFPIGLIVSPLRVACTNQFVLLKQKAFIELRYKHTSTGVTQFNKNVKIVEQVYNALKGQLEIAEKLANMECTTEKGTQFLTALKDKKILPEKFIDRAVNLWENPIRPEDEGRNNWILFNAVTDPLNRELENKTKLNTFNQIEKVGEVFTELTHV